MSYWRRRKTIDPKVRRLFPWALFLVAAAILTLFTMISRAYAQDTPPNLTCEEVVKRVGLKPLWLAEREARKTYPTISDEQIAWGRQCVTDHRHAIIENIKNKVTGVF